MTKETISTSLTVVKLRWALVACVDVPASCILYFFSPMKSRRTENTPVSSRSR